MRVLSQAELMRLPLLYEVVVTGTDASAGDERSECGWRATQSS